MSNQEDQDKFDFPFPYEVFDDNGKLILKHLDTGMVGELDFDINQNLKKSEEKQILKIKKSDTIMKKKKDKTEETEDTKDTEDLIEEDAKMEIKDGQKVKVEAEGDDDEVEEKIKGDPYQDGNKKKGEKFVKGNKDTVDINTDLLKRIEALEAESKAKDVVYGKLAKKQEANDASDLEELKEVLQVKPYEVPLETMKDMSLEDLTKQKEFLDALPHIKDFYESDPLTYEDVNRIAVDMGGAQRADPRTSVLEKAQVKFVSDMSHRGAKKT